MEKPALVEYFSYYLKHGKDAESLTEEALTKNYQLKDIEDSMKVALKKSEPEMEKSESRVAFEQMKSTNRKIWVTITIVVLLFVIILIAAYLLAFRNAFAVKAGEIEKTVIECGVISSEVLDSNNLEKYLEENPLDREKFECVSESLRECKDMKLRIGGERDAIFSLNSDGEKCLTSYNITYFAGYKCERTKEQLQLMHEIASNRGLSHIMGINLVIGMDLTLDAHSGDTGTELHEIFKNPKTGEEERVNCRIY
jgi:hypothetical protein